MAQTHSPTLVMERLLQALCGVDAREQVSLMHSVINDTLNKTIAY